MRAKAEWAIDAEAMRARGIIVLVKSNSWSKISRIPVVGYNIKPSSSSTNKNAALIIDH